MNDRDDAFVIVTDIRPAPPRTALSSWIEAVWYGIFVSMSATSYLSLRGTYQNSWPAMSLLMFLIVTTTIHAFLTSPDRRHSP